MKTCSKCKKEKELTEFCKRAAAKDGLHPFCSFCRSSVFKEYRSKNLDKLKKRSSKWKKDNPSRHCSLNAKRKAIKLKATPCWSNNDIIQSYYNVCNFFNEVNGFTKYHVDHIIPLQGKNVCGLHVQNNLQIILATDNLRKYNKHECTNN